MKTTSNLLQTLNDKAKKAIWFLGVHAFSFIILLFFVSFICAGFIFYEYVFFAEREVPHSNGNIIKFDEKMHCFRLWMQKQSVAPSKKDAPVLVTDRSFHFIVSPVLWSVPFLQIACAKNGKSNKLKKEKSSCSVEYTMPGL